MTEDDESCPVPLDTAYGLEWDHLSPEVQASAYAKGVDEYWKWDCWFEGTDRPLAELKREGCQVLSAAWRGQRAKLDPDGRLIGRVRWTPKGYQQWDEGESYESPTAHTVSSRVLDVLGKQSTLHPLILAGFFFWGPGNC